MSRLPNSSRRVMVAPKGVAKSSQSAKIGRSNLLLKNRKPMSTPRADMLMNLGIEKTLASAYAIPAVAIDDLPDLGAVPPSQFNEVLQKKLQECCVSCNWGDLSKDSMNRTAKSRYLQDILDFLSKPRYFQLCDTTTFDRLFDMIRTNLFRALPPIPPLAKSPLLGDDIKDTYIDAAWSHLQFVYQIFQLWLESPQMQASQHVKRFDHSFLVSFFGLFNSMDIRERDSIKQTLHALYLKFNQLRPTLRQMMQEIFLTFIYETKYYNGINELLDFYESIVSGFTVPIKPENIKFLFDILIPLHASDVLHVYYENLTACVGDFLEKDPNLVPVVLMKLLRYWPLSSTVKARLFMAEIGQIIEVMSDDQFKEVAVDLMVFVSNAIESVNFAVAEAAICLWKSDIFVEYIVVNAAMTYPIVVPALYRSGVGHWNAAITNLAVSVLRICMQTSPEIYDQVIKGLQEIEALTASRLKAERGAWLEVARQAERFARGIRIVNRPLPIDRVFAT